MTMTEQKERITASLFRDKKVWIALLATIALAVLLAALVIWSLLAPAPERAEDDEEEELEEEIAPLLVTRRQLEEMTYTDSSLGELRWELTEESLEELDRVLRDYGITTPEAISQFLAQAAVETAAGRYLTELGDGSWLCVYFDDYLTLTGEDEYPTGYIRYTTTEERRVLNQMQADYDVDPVYVLDMYRHGKVSWMLDVLLRLAVLVVAGIIGVTVRGVWKRRNKSVQTD